jgi:hypothetical protein
VGNCSSRELRLNREASIAASEGSQQQQQLFLPRLQPQLRHQTNLRYGCNADIRSALAFDLAVLLKAAAAGLSGRFPEALTVAFVES